MIIYIAHTVHGKIYYMVHGKIYYKEHGNIYSTYITWYNI